MFQYGVVLPFLLRILIRMRRTRTTLIVPEFMNDKDTLINVRNQIHEKLLTELESLVVSLLLVPEFMNDKDKLINVRNQNHEKLLTELESLVVSQVLVHEILNYYC